ncbi:MAG: alpha/beta hydrolase [Crocinitomicaceae bacterium]
MRILIFTLFMTGVIAFGSNNIEVNKDDFELEYLIRRPKDTVKKAPVLLLLHGYGSNENDLFSLSPQIPENWLVVSVRAPIKVNSNQYKWYDVKLVDEKITINTHDEEKSRKSLLRFIEEIVSKYNGKKDRVVTAGFSQGANIALSLTLTAPEKVFAAACFSGRFMPEIEPHIANSNLLIKKEIFIGHGTEDKMLPLKYATNNQAILQSYGIQVTLFTDKIAHAISQKEAKAFTVWLNRLKENK